MSSISESKTVSSFLQGSDIPVKGPSLQAVPVSPRLLQGRRRRTCPVTGGGHSDSQLTHEICCATTGIWCSSTSAIWGFGSTWKRASCPLCRPSLFSLWSWNQLVLNCLNSFRGKTAVPLKEFQRLQWHMAYAEVMMPLELMHERQLQN